MNIFYKIFFILIIISFIGPSAFFLAPIFTPTIENSFFEIIFINLWIFPIIFLLALIFLLVGIFYTFKIKGWFMPQPFTEEQKSNFYKKLKTRIFFFVLLLIIIITLGSIFLESSIRGKVVNTATGIPIPNIEIERRSESLVYAFDPGGGTHYQYYNSEVIYTDNNGNYNFGPRFHFRHPFAKTRVWLSVNGEDGYQSRNPSYYAKTTLQEEKNIEGERDFLLSPIVSDLIQCKGNKDCIEDNIAMGRNCRDYKTSDNDSVCKNFILNGGKMFDTTENDFVSCNGLGEIESVKCVQNLAYGGCNYKTIPDDLSCSKLDTELARNYCFYKAMKCYNQQNFDGTKTYFLQITDLCKKITKKLIPGIELTGYFFIPERDDYKSDPDSGFIYETGRDKDGMFNNIYDMCMAFVEYNSRQYK